MIVIPVNTAHMNLDNCSVDFQGFAVSPSITGLTVGQSATRDYLIPNASVISGTGIYLTGIMLNDYITCQIIDKDNVLGGGVNAIVSTPITKYYVISGADDIDFIMLTYVPAATYYRLIYTVSANSLTIVGRINLNIFRLNP